jgi:anti-sigma-K factor RskA
VTDSWDDEDRAIARALGAADDAETPGAPERMVDEYQDVLGHLSPEVMPPPELEDRVMSAALARRPAVASSVDPTRRRRVNRVRAGVLVAAVVAAAVVIGVIVTRGSTGTPPPAAHISLATVQHSDVEALLRAPGTRTGVFRPALPIRGRVALGVRGDGIVYDLRTNAPVSLGLISAPGSTVIGPARAVDGAIRFTVDHPDRVTAVDLIRNGETIGRAQLTSR